MEVYEREGLSPYKLDPETGEKFYINTPPGVNLVDLLEGEDKQEYLDLLQKQDFEVRASDRTYNVETGVGGIGAGDYGTVIRPPEVSGSDRLTAIAAPLLASAMLGPLAGKLPAAAGATGATGTALTNALTSAAVAEATGGDPLRAAITSGIDSGLGILEAQAPALYNDIEFAYNVAKGEPALALFNRGTNVIEDGEITGTTTIGERLTTNALDKVGLTVDALGKYDIDQDDLVSGVAEVERELIKGNNFEDSLRSGLIEYAREGGGAPDFGINLGIALETPEFVSDIARAVREFGSEFDDIVLQPPKEFVEEIVEAIPEPDIDLAGVDIPIPSVDVDIPSVDVDLPSVDVDMPSVDLDIPSPSIGLAISQPQPTKSVTESLFEDFLFEKKYQAPELIERRVPLQNYQAPSLFRGFV
jgi:hypothetical protein